MREHDYDLIMSLLCYVITITLIVTFIARFQAMP